MIARLLSRPHHYNLFQAIALLERATPSAAPIGKGNGDGEGVRLHGHVSVAFEASDVRAVTQKLEAGRWAQTPHTRYALSTPVMTLAGASSPLPLAYTELVLQRRAARDHATADFLDIFNHRFLSFFYRGRKKHALGLNASAPQASALVGCLDALSDLGYARGEAGPRGQRLWIRHAGLLGGAARPMTGLLALLADRLGLNVRGQQFVGQWRSLDPQDYSRLGGKGLALDASRALGRRVWDQAAGIRIEFLDLEPARFDRLLPGGDDHDLALWLIRCHVRRDLNVDFVLHPRPRAGACALGGTAAARLGWTSWATASPQNRIPTPVRLAARVALSSSSANRI
ncbi:type VI secretion system baseplate subunit TssG [Achromobacter insolitus]|uniref:type VI secretion system baseplate subunit TssG n=1 Tax=Achromobacter insolitus TaxID=217204 RepID=UPI000A4A00C0|nr:type VI secretion system baseplate subunit TssG [Achromobacter insolitus]